MSNYARIFVIFVIFALGLARAVAADEPLVVVTRDGAPIAGPAFRHASTFSELTGSPVELRRLKFKNLYDEIMISFVTGTHPGDVLIIPPAWVPDFAPFLSEVPDAQLKSLATALIQPVYKEPLMKWDGRWLAMTVDGDVHIGAYRKDLFESQRFRQAFAREYGRSLEPPRTWAEYIEIAGFFDGQTDESGQRIFGTLEAYAEGGQRMWYLISHAVPYASHPQFPGYLFFDPTTMAPTINSPAWKRAVEEYVRLKNYGPPDADALDSHSVRQRFARGEAAMAIDWSDLGVLTTDPETSAVAGNVGFFALPGSRRVWNPDQQNWDMLGHARAVPFLALGGWVAVVPASTTDQERAWAFVDWYGSPANSLEDLRDGSTGINPYRSTHLTNAVGWGEMMGKAAAEQYLNVLKDSLSAPQVAHELRIPGYRAYMGALDTQLRAVLAGTVSIDEALNTAAVQWDEITDRLGRESQLRHYRALMRLAEVGP